MLVCGIYNFFFHLVSRPRFPVAVNCWFCNKNTRVPYGNRDRWDCPHCEQYNGFSLVSMWGTAWFWFWHNDGYHGLYVLNLIIIKFCLNTLRPEQNGHHFPEDIFKWIFVNKNAWFFIKNSLKLVPMGPINNIPALVQIMVWHWPGDKPLSEPMMAWVTEAYMRHSASMFSFLQNL